MSKRVPISASAILFNKNSEKSLLLRRGPTDKFAPNAYVFPGGVLERKYDTKFPLNLTNYDKIITPKIKPNNMENDFSLRVCSLRELFEETGLLFVTEKNNSKKKVLSSLDDGVLDKMKHKIKSNPMLFKDLFTDFHLDLDALTSLSYWMTPHGLPIRFETLFYVINVNEEHKIDLCKQEMTDCTWMKLEDILKNPDVKNYLPPPQIYEICRLHWSKYEKIEIDSKLIFPQLIFAKDPTKPDVYALPGDHLFIENMPPESEYDKRIMTFEEVDSYSKTKKVNRILFTNYKNSNFSDLVIRNFDKNDKNKPIMFEYISKFNSK
ncbi:Nucleoside diphosphate-linked moiety X motif 19, mitochondrial [Strongyloides ratti]|uniref:Nucleoside diphosphate-linked moiety X motif 19, mitochondrial n=1 Tax=Strongyloides ratti TaxID=34506 RepID=A0A090L4Q6_STRRB|nr:Nucleoside diphosphate-linked moiety X motif 19, mitochondrial [Strongyloides ratti]CEF64771.1 Nucleoside diphosphate-linked moiety X motif 19, mitochondrial [Strongyloides ratti]